MDEDLQVIWNTFYCYTSQGLIEVDAKIERFASDIINMLQHPERLIYNDM